MSSDRALAPHPDRLLPAEPSTRAVARRLYEEVRDLPILSPHGHVPARLLADDTPFTDPTSLLVSPDHYVTRLLHADGVPLDALGVRRDGLDPADARQAWRILCERWRLFGGTPVRYWLETELAEIFGVTVRPSAQTADAVYDAVAARLATPGFRPRALLERFGIEVLATPDDPLDDLDAHARLAADPGVATRVVPTFRPDRYLEPASDGWCDVVDRDGDHRGVHGAAPAPARRDGADVRRGRPRHDAAPRRPPQPPPGDVREARRGRRRGHPRRGRADPGAGAPARPVRDRGRLPPRALHPRRDVVLREIAPRAGFYPSVYVGAPWWFLDAPDAIGRFRGAVTETVGYTRTSGFVDDTRAFCSIPARHDMARRLDCGHLARLIVEHRIVEHRLEEDEAVQTAHDLVAVNPRKAFKL